jgi:SPP1 family predicted phage head-tail adaptor
MKLLFDIMEQTPGNDLDGIPSTWGKVDTQWGEIRPLSGREYEAAQQMQSSVTHRIQTHLVATANSAMRLVAGDRVFEVESVINEGERNRFHVWRCTEGGM